jgi:GTP-binding protein
MTFGPNSSPFVGKSGEFITYRQIEARLMKEIQKDVSLRVQRIENSESFLVSGRGELHLGILIENMRREGFELEVSKPQVIIKTIDDQKHEPYEDVYVDIPHDYLGMIMDAMAVRSGSLIHMESLESITRLTYEIPSRGLIGFQNHFMTLTKGYGIINHAFKDYRPLTGLASHQRKMGTLVATETGTATTYAIEQIEDRGTLFITPGTEVYEGMIVGENKYDRTLVVNVAKVKALTNVRSSNKELKVVLKAPRRMSLEECLDYLNDDELVEITPTHIRMRKKILKANERKRYQAYTTEEES